MFCSVSGTYSDGNTSTCLEVDKEIMLSVAGALEFEALVKVLPLTQGDIVLPLTQGDIEQIKANYQRMDQRCFQALDAWARRGPGRKRYVSELLQVMSAMGRTDMVKFINSKSKFSI